MAAARWSANPQSNNIQLNFCKFAVLAEMAGLLLWEFEVLCDNLNYLRLKSKDSFYTYRSCSCGLYHLRAASSFNIVYIYTQRKIISVTRNLKTNIISTVIKLCVCVAKFQILLY